MMSSAADVNADAAMLMRMMSVLYVFIFLYLSQILSLTVHFYPQNTRWQFLIVFHDVILNHLVNLIVNHQLVGSTGKSQVVFVIVIRFLFIFVFIKDPLIFLWCRQFSEDSHHLPENFLFTTADIHT